ncbi:MAG: molybdopterin-dependent oxidoreductase [bacterium]
MIKIRINDHEFEVEPGLTVIQAADRCGIYIPRFCYLEKLSPLGGCRMCLISIQGIPKLQTACTTPAREGMAIITESEEIHKARKAMLEFQLIQHPLDCFYCDKAAECDLQDLTYQFGEIKHRHDFPKRKGTIIYENPLIQRTLERCVHCERCIRVCKEIQGAHALSATRRGRLTTIREVPGGGECEHCGHCIDVCPVGANLDRLFTYGGRPFQMEKGKTICPYCGCGCTLTMNTREGMLMRVRGGKEEGVNRGSLCARGRFGWGIVHHPGRLVRPLIKKQGKLLEVEWDEALLFTATRLQKIIKEKGGAAVGGLGSARASDEANYLFQRFMRRVIGSNHIDSSARLHYTAGLIGRLGVKAEVSEATLEDVRNASRILIIGADPVETNPILGLAIKKMLWKGGRAVLADPRSTRTGRIATRHIRIRPGTEVPLILGLGLEILKEPSLSGFTREEVMKNCGIFAPDMDEILSVLTGPAAQKSVVLMGRGVMQAPFGATAVSVLLRAAARAGASYLFTMDRNNERGSCEMGVLPDRLPGLAPLSDRGRFEKIWGDKIPAAPGLSAYDMLHAAKEGTLHALYIMGENPMVDFPDTKFVEDALNSLEFLVVQDLFMTRTASMADVVLPTASFAEKSGGFTNLEGRVQSFTPLIPSSVDVMPDSRIIVELSRKMGKGFPFKSLTEVREEIHSLVPVQGWKRKISGEDMDLPCPGAGVHWGPADDPEFPFLLLLTSSLYRNGSMSNLAPGLAMAQDKAGISLNPLDASELGITQGDKIILTSRNGEVHDEAGICDSVSKGTLQMPEGFANASPKGLLSHDLDPVTRAPMGRYVQVKIRKI